MGYHLSKKSKPVMFDAEELDQAIRAGDTLEELTEYFKAFIDYIVGSNGWMTGPFAQELQENCLKVVRRILRKKEYVPGKRGYSKAHGYFFTILTNACKTYLMEKSKVDPRAIQYATDTEKKRQAVLARGQKYEHSHRKLKKKFPPLTAKQLDRLPLQWVSAIEAGKILGITREAIYQRASSGLMRAGVFHGKMYVRLANDLPFGWLSVEEAAKVLGITPHSVYVRVREKKMKKKKYYGKLFVKISEDV